MPLVSAILGLALAPEGGPGTPSSHPRDSNLTPAGPRQRDQSTGPEMERLADLAGVWVGEYHWHKHDDDDEFFFVFEGQPVD